MSKGSNTQQTQQSSSVSPNPDAMAAYEQLLSRSQNVSNTPFTAFSGQEVAPINAQQQSGVGNINTAAGGFSPYAGNAGAMINSAGQPITALDISQFESPYTSQVVNATQAEFDNQNAQTNSMVTGNAAAQGALGGNRVGVAQALASQQEQLAQAPVIAGLQNQGFQTALTAAQQQKQQQQSAGTALNAAGLNAAQSQVGAGTLEQQTSQAQDTQAMTDYYTAQGYPFATAQWLAGITLGTGAQMGSTSTGQSTTEGPQPNQFLQGAGLGIAGLGALGSAGGSAGIAGLAPLFAALNTGGAVTVPEKKLTLKEQQKHLVGGGRDAQMFPHGTDELPLPKGSKKLKTEKGIFHYNPSKISPNHIHNAVSTGRENDILNLGSVSKEEVMHRMRGGETPVSIVERKPDGTEVRAAAGTHGTAHHQFEYFHRTKSHPSNSVDMEHPAETIRRRRSNGGLVSGFADGGTPYGPGTQGWVPTIGKVGGATLHDPGVQSPKMSQQQQADPSALAKGFGKINWGKFGSSSASDGYDWGANPTGGYEGAGEDVTSGYATGGVVRRGFEDGGVPSFDDRFSGGDDATPVSLGFTGALEPNYEKRFGAGVPIVLPESKGFEPVQGDPTGVEDKVPVPTPRPDIAGPPGQGVKSGVGPAAYPTEGGISAPDTTSRRAGDIKQVIANEWSRAGMSPQGITGIYMNIADESRFDPTSRHWDQPNPRFRGTEAENAHGLYQEGGDEWNKYQSWLQKNAPGSDWRDPALQSRFTAENLKANYPQVWDRMQNAKTPGEAAAAFVAGYLKPAREHLAARTNKYLSGEGENPDVMQASYRSGFAPESTGVPRGQPPFIPGVTAAPPAKPSGGPFGLSSEASQALMSMGLSMMANRRGGKGSFLAGVGEGGEQGMTTYASARAATQGQEALTRKEALERESMMLPYSNMTMNERVNAQLNAQKALEATRQHNMAMKTPVQYYKDDDGVSHYAIPRPAPNGEVDFYPIDAKGNISTSPLGGSLKDAAQQNAPPELSTPATPPQLSSGPKLQQAGYNPDEGIIRTASKMEDSGQTFDYAKNTPIVDKGTPVPRPSPIAGHSTQSIEADAEKYIETGALPPARTGPSPAAIAQSRYRTAVQNYGVAKAASMGMDEKDLTMAQRTAPGMLRFLMNPQTGGTTVALGTAIRHLDTLEELARVWHSQAGSGDFVTKNRILGSLRREFGNDAITSLESAASIVGPEIIKAIGVAGGGTAEDRSAAEKRFGPYLAPGQLYGNVKTVEKLLAGQLEGKERQATSVGVSQEQFKKLIGDRPYTLLKGFLDAEKGGSTAKNEMSTQEQAAMKWANANPTDPRADAIKKKLGVQ